MRPTIVILMALCVLLSMVLAIRTYTNSRSTKPEPTVKPTPSSRPTHSAPATISDGDLVLDLFNPSEASLTGQLNETALKARLEDTITLSFMLRRCEYLTQQSYDDTYRALAIYTQRMSPGISDAQLQTTITNAVEAGNASYGLIYSRLSCNLPQLAVANTQLAQWRASMLNPPQ